MAATLDDVVKIMRTQSDKQDDTTSAIDGLTNVFTKFFLKEERGSGDRLEAERENRGSGPIDLSGMMAIPGLDALNSSIQGLVLMGTNFAKMIAGIGLGIAGVLAALAGIRGWEAKAIANIGKIGKALDNLFPGSFTGTITKAIENLRLGILRRVFGIGPEGKMIRTPDNTRFAGKLSVADAVRDAMAAFRTRMLARFGLGADGKLISVRGADGRFKTNFIGRVTLQVRSLFRPIQNLGESLGKFFKGDIWKGISKFVGIGGRTILAIFKKVFYPIGLVFSAFQGLKDFMDSDAETIIGQLGDGVAGFVGDFIGAPFDLLKAGINYVFDKIFGVKRDQNGNVTTEGWASWASEAMKKFSFTELIKNIVAAPFKVLEASFLFIKELFTDPKEALDNFWERLTGVNPSLFKFGEYIFNNLVLPAWNFVTGLFKQDPKEENELGMSLDNVLTGTINLFKNIGHFIGGIIDIVSTEVEFQIKKVVNGFKNSFDRVATFIRNLGDNLYIMMSNALQFNFPGIILNKPDGATGKVLEKIGVPFPLEIMPAFSLGLGNSETRAAAESRIDTRNAKMYNRISARNNETAEAFAEAEAAKANLMTGMQPVFITNNNSTTNNSTNNSRSFVATGATTDPNGINLSQQVQP